MRVRRDVKDGGSPIAHYWGDDDDDARPIIRRAAFPSTPEYAYWTSSPDVGDSNFAWNVNFSNGGVNGSNRVNNYYVRLVR
ncbi:MAG: DUF1566 domain-containing protein [Cytophagales bacterium]|nr:DUF1566 domain-containing protein [Cytophagales bacterium]